MDCIKAVQNYVDRMITSSGVTGMKVLLLDRETKGIVSMVYTMSQILEKEVYLAETIDSAHETMLHMKALCFLRPIRENIDLLRQELKSPKYAEYHIFFSNILPQDSLRILAEADEHAVVKSVQEYYADYYPINSDFFTLNLGQSLALADPRSLWIQPTVRVFERSCEGLLAVLLSLKAKPFIRYSGSSEVSQLFARKVQTEIKNQYKLFDFRRDSRTLLLVLDRRDDPVTPLLMQWTYQAMTHELLTLRNNIVDMRKVPGIKKELQEIALSTEQDAFFAKNLYANLGDLGVAVKELLDDYQSERKTHDNISSVEDMERFVERYPELRKRSVAVGKHVALMGHLARLVEERNLMETSTTEQNLSATNSEAHFTDIMGHIEDHRVPKFNALILVMLYALRYEKSRSSKLGELKEALVSFKGVSREELRWIDALLQYGGADVRAGDLFGNKSMMSKVRGAVKRGVTGVSNVFTQHETRVGQLLEQLARGKLSKAEREFPYLGAEPPAGPFGNVVVFYLGGATYEEAAKIAALNAAGGGPHVILGGTFVHNSSTFLDELAMRGAHSAVPMGGGAGGY